MRAFINFSSGRCYRIYNLLWSDAKASFWDLLHSGYADSLGWFKQSAADFENGEIAEFAASVGLYTHKHYTKRISHGVHVKPERITLDALKARIKNVKIREKINAFFEGKKKSKKSKNTQ
jgi:hypothetical protein